MNARCSRGSNPAFTLIEIIVAMAVLSIMVSITFISIASIRKEQAAREPVSELHRLARTVRARAMAEQRPYQIVFTGTGFQAARYFNPYGEDEQFETLKTEIEMIEQQREIIEASRERGIDMNAGREPTRQDRAAEAAREGMSFLESYEIPDNVRYSLRFWNDTEWLDMASGQFRRWVFQPSGMCEEMKIRVESDNAFFEVTFHPLTADVKKEQSWVE